MIQLSPDESRVLGVLVEKATTTPEQYPLSLNAVVNGANQKNNRDPVITMEEGAAFEALEGLRAKGLVVRVDMAGSRAERYAQLLCPDLHPLDIAAGASASAPAAVSPSPGGSALSERVTRLEAEVDALRRALRRIATAVGEPDPLAADDDVPDA